MKPKLSYKKIELPFLKCYNHGCASYTHNAVQKIRVTYNPNEWCERYDSNVRTSTRQGPVPCAFDLAGQPPYILKIKQNKGRGT